MIDLILYLSLLLVIGGVYVLISYFNDDDGEKFTYNSELTYLAR